MTPHLAAKLTVFFLFAVFATFSYPIFETVPSALPSSESIK